MGWHAGRKLRSAVSNLTTIIAIEFMAASRGLELRAPLMPGPVTRELLHDLRKTTTGAGPDQFLAPQIQATREFIVSRFLTKTLSC
jgi:histidine ammonia-lyase